MDDRALGPVLPINMPDRTGYGFRIQKPGLAIRHPVMIVYGTEKEAKEARDTVRAALEKAIAVIEFG